MNEQGGQVGFGIRASSGYCSSSLFETFPIGSGLSLPPFLNILPHSNLYVLRKLGFFQNLMMLDYIYLW